MPVDLGTAMLGVDGDRSFSMCSGCKIAEFWLAGGGLWCRRTKLCFTVHSAISVKSVQDVIRMD